MTKLAIVTGGTRGIGAAISQGLKDKGYKVAANYARSKKAAEEFTAQTGIKSFKWDVTSYKECESGINKIVDEFGQTPDILVNNAGIIEDATLHKMTEDNWHNVIRTNLDSCYNMSHHVIRNMRESGFGRIVSISSINALAGQFGQTNYCAAKAGMIGFTKALALETAGKGITVNAVAPGYIKTEMTEAVPRGVMEAIISQIPVKRLGRPYEIASAVTFLVSDDASFITGETISVNGGHYMQ